MVRASVMLSATTNRMRGDGLLMSDSRAKRPAAIIDAAMTNVEAKRSRVGRSSITITLCCTSMIVQKEQQSNDE